MAPPKCFAGIAQLCGGSRGSRGYDNWRQRSQTLAALRSIRGGYESLANIELPPSAGHALVALWNSMRDLESILGKETSPVCLPWFQPLVEEEREWESLCPEGGQLLRTQVCVAAEAEEDSWCIGRLFISSEGLLFDAGWGRAPFLLYTGLLRWADIDLERSDSRWNRGFAEVILSLQNRRNESPERYLRLQLSMSRDVDCLMDLWSGFAADIKFIQRLAEESSAGDNAMGDEESLRDATPLASTPSLRKASICSEVPCLQEPEDLEPIFEQRLPDVDLESLRVKLQREDESWPIAQLLLESVNAFDLQPSSWVEARNSSATLVRRLRFQMVLPNDVPSFVMRLMALPETSSCTMVGRLRCSEDELVLLLQVCTHDVTYGENFRTQDTLVFKRDPAGGVTFRKFFEIIWVAPLPWTHAAIKSFVESKAKSSSVVSAQYLVQILQENADSPTRLGTGAKRKGTSFRTRNGSIGRRKTEVLSLEETLCSIL